MLRSPRVQASFLSLLLLSLIFGPAANSSFAIAEVDFPSSEELAAAVYEGVTDGISGTSVLDPIFEDLKEQDEGPAPDAMMATSHKITIKYKVVVGIWPVLIERTVIVEIYTEDGKVIIKTKIGDDPATTEEVKPDENGKPTKEEIAKLKKALDDLKKDKSQDGGEVCAGTSDGAKEKIKEDIRRRLKAFVDGKAQRM